MSVALRPLEDGDIAWLDVWLGAERLGFRSAWLMDHFVPVVAPSTFIITCADAGIGVQHLHWTSWTPKLASGYGTFWENDCTPNRAEGHFHSYPSLEVLWGSATVKGHPADRRYTKLTVIFTGKTRPPVYVLKNGKLVATYPLTQTFPAI